MHKQNYSMKLSTSKSTKKMMTPAIPLETEFNIAELEWKAFKYNIGPTNNQRKQEVHLLKYEKGRH